MFTGETARAVLVVNCVICVFICGGDGCLPADSSVESLLAGSPFVIQGRVEEILQNSAVVHVTALYKGQLSEGDAAVQGRRIVVGPFGTEEDRTNCVGGGGSNPVGSEAFLFLNDTGLRVETGTERLRKFLLMTTPRPISQEILRVVEGHGCPDCITSSIEEKPHAIVCAENTYCFNDGSCYIMPTLGLRFCQCMLGFHGARCQEKLVPGEKRHPEENLLKNNFFPIVIGSVVGFCVVVALVILLVVAIKYGAVVAIQVKRSQNLSKQIQPTQIFPIQMTPTKNSYRGNQLTEGQDDLGSLSEASTLSKEGRHGNGGSGTETNGKTSAEEVAPLLRSKTVDQHLPDRSITRPFHPLVSFRSNNNACRNSSPFQSLDQRKTQEHNRPPCSNQTEGIWIRLKEPAAHESKVNHNSRLGVTVV